MKWRVTCINNTTGEIFTCEEDYFGFPSHICEPYSGTDRTGAYQTGLILRVEKILYDV